MLVARDAILVDQRWHARGQVPVERRRHSALLSVTRFTIPHPYASIFSILPNIKKRGEVNELKETINKFHAQNIRPNAETFFR